VALKPSGWSSGHAHHDACDAQDICFGASALVRSAMRWDIPPLSPACATLSLSTASQNFTNALRKSATCPIRVMTARRMFWKTSHATKGRCAPMTVRSDKIDVQWDEWANAPVASGAAVWLLPHLGEDRPLDFSLLSSADREAAARYKAIPQRRRFLATRVLLRLALTKASQGQVAATEWRFEESALGKPYVAADLPQIQFSVSHNDIASVVAISRTAVVGVDIERLDQEINESLIAIFCSGYERIQLRRMSKEECTLAFLKLWTLKEAYTKMVGFGFLEDFSALEFDSKPLRLVGDPNSRFKSSIRIIGGTPCQISLAWLSVGRGRPSLRSIGSRASDHDYQQASA
jgi:phosphopantetheinyl transferase